MRNPILISDLYLLIS